MTKVPATTVNVELAEEHQLSYQARRADPLALVAESYLERDSKSASTADRYQVVVHVDAETLKDQTAGRCQLEHGSSLPAETVRRLACDASLIRVVETERGEPLDVGRKTRTIPPAIRRALNARDPGCCFPGCRSHHHPLAGRAHGLRTRRLDALRSGRARQAFGRGLERIPRRFRGNV